MLKIKSVKFGRVFLILVLILLIGGCAHKKESREESGEQVSEEIRVYINGIPDQKRVEQLLMLFDTLKQDVTVLNQTLDKFNSDTQALIANYDATKEDFNELFNEFNAARKGLQQKILASYFKMKALTTQEEWKGLAKLEEKALSKVMKRTLMDN